MQLFIYLLCEYLAQICLSRRSLIPKNFDSII